MREAPLDTCRAASASEVDIGERVAVDDENRSASSIGNARAGRRRSRAPRAPESRTAAKASPSPTPR
jgi:hypothetical protein